MKPKHWFSRLPFLRLKYSRFTLSALCLLLLAGFAFAREAKKPAKALPPSEQQTAPAGDLEAVLAKMNQSAARFKSAQGDFEFQSYQKLTDDTDTQKGRIYFRRKDKGVDAAFEIVGPAPKQVVYKDGKLQIFEKKINQVTERNVGKNKSDVEAFLSLGFGASGDELQRDYAVKMDGWETVDGVKTAKLDLTPKKEKVLQTYNKIILWIDPERDVLLKQQFFEHSGDYRLAHYTNLKLNDKIPDDAFRLKTNGNTKTIKPQ
ncbi:MAG TPA: outer membrane lipoprotein carrier protein LolA [Candidatus Dormibacteraeota bacterium]|jgi:outer membrane lipoprotein-sorting protein|nr:outer membrane lipoprotein carrier protein LolA [Candidatus Dormibacteraeota bacterium]